MKWYDKIVEARVDAVEQKPKGKGWLTFKQILKMSPYGIVKTRQLLQGSIKAGTTEVFAGTAMGYVRYQPQRMVWYKIRKKLF